MSRQTFVKTRHFSFREIAALEYAPGMEGKSATHLMRMYRQARGMKKPVILELGTKKGRSTTVFLQACEETGGRLVSVDIQDCSDVSSSPRWKFVRSDSTDVRAIMSRAPF